MFLNRIRCVADHVVEQVAERVAVRRGLRAGPPGERAAGAGTVVDDHRLTQHLLQLLRHRPHRDVAQAAGGTGEMIADGPGRIVLRVMAAVRARRREARAVAGKQCNAYASTDSFHYLPSHFGHRTATRFQLSTVYFATISGLSSRPRPGPVGTGSVAVCRLDRIVHQEIAQRIVAHVVLDQHADRAGSRYAATPAGSPRNASRHSARSRCPSTASTRVRLFICASCATAFISAEAAAASQRRLHDVDAARIDQLLEVVHAVMRLARRDARPASARAARRSLVISMGGSGSSAQWMLNGSICLHRFECDVDGVVAVVVHHQQRLVADRLARGAHPLDVGGDAGADLDLGAGEHANVERPQAAPRCRPWDRR